MIPERHHRSLALLFVASLSLVGTQGATQNTCPDLFGAEAAHKRCGALAAEGHCGEAIGQCALAAKRCPAVPAFTLSLARLRAQCLSREDKGAAGLDGDCRRDIDCRRGLRCEARACRPAPGARVKVLELQVNARRIATHTPCDARAMLEQACGMALSAGHGDLQPRLQRDLGHLRALCPDFKGPLCGGLLLDLGTMVPVPAGPFQRGSTESGLGRGLALCRDTYSSPIDCNIDWFKREIPRKSVSLKAFEIDRFEVTNTQYRACVEAGGCKEIDYGSCKVYEPESGSWSSGGAGHNQLKAAQHPVVCVTWKEATDFCTWAGKRLPTEAEWEKAARGDKDDREFPWGDRWEPTFLNWGELAGFGATDGFETSAPVGAFPQNVSPFGAFDMAGNVWEWTVDRFDALYYADATTTDPLNLTKGDTRALRGGSWSFAGNGSRTSYRFYSDPGTRDDAIGFRCAR